MQLDETHSKNYMSIIARDFNTHTKDVSDFIDIDNSKYVPVDDLYISDEISTLGLPKT